MRGTRFFTGLSTLALVACGSVPVSNPAPVVEPEVPLLSDLDVAEDTSSVPLAATPPSANGGFLSGLFGGNAAPETTGVDTALAEALGDDDDAVVADATITADAPTPVAAAAAQPGLLGRLFNASAGTSAPASGSAPENQIPPRTIMAFGEIGPTCGLSRRDMGTEIAKASGYTIYDTIPNSTAPRPHYITGFGDGCARQFTAALVLMGDVGTHEIVRYSRTRVDLPYSETDNAYEAIKASFCRVGYGQPCGAKLERLGNRTAFVTAYERFGAGPIWAEFLLHDGGVAAADLEGN